MIGTKSVVLLLLFTNEVVLAHFILITVYSFLLFIFFLVFGGFKAASKIKLPGLKYR